ncbi:hypothetical protein Efla_003192 [Eimeria flavescens]
MTSVLPVLHLDRESRSGLPLFCKALRGPANLNRGALPKDVTAPRLSQESGNYPKCHDTMDDTTYYARIIKSNSQTDLLKWRRAHGNSSLDSAGSASLLVRECGHRAPALLNAAKSRSRLPTLRRQHLRGLGLVLLEKADMENCMFSHRRRQIRLICYLSDLGNDLVGELQGRQQVFPSSFVREYKMRHLTERIDNSQDGIVASSSLG